MWHRHADLHKLAASTQHPHNLACHTDTLAASLQVYSASGIARAKLRCAAGFNELVTIMVLGSAETVNRLKRTDSIANLDGSEPLYRMKSSAPQL